MKTWQVREITKNGYEHPGYGSSYRKNDELRPGFVIENTILNYIHALEAISQQQPQSVKCRPLRLRWRFSFVVRSKTKRAPQARRLWRSPEDFYKLSAVNECDKNLPCVSLEKRVFSLLRDSARKMWMLRLEKSYWNE